MKQSKNKIILVSLILLFVFLYFFFDIQNLLTLSTLKENQEYLKSLNNANPLFFSTFYFLIYILITALSIPGAIILTLAGGALFGLIKGILIISFASTIGATLAFLVSRYLLREKVQVKFSKQLNIINEGLEKEGLLYLLGLRLIPLFPFFLINLLMGLTKIKTWSFYIISQIGMLLGTIIYVNAGVELSKIQDVQGILSPRLILAFTLIGIFPIFIKIIIQKIKTSKAYSSYKKPKHFDYNMIVIGGGAGGLVTSYISALVNAKVLLVEKSKMGGDCLNTGCVPSKALIKSANIIHLKSKSSTYGLNDISINYDFSKIMNRIKEIIKKIEPHDSIERYKSLGVDCLQAEAKVISPWEVIINDKVYTTKNITIATGASPFIPDIPGLRDISPLTSDTIWNLDSLPENLIVIGAGAIGLELGQAFNRLGSKVSIIDIAEHILPREDYDISDLLEEKLAQEGIIFYKNAKIKKCLKETQEIVIESQNNEILIPFSKCLVAIGRKAHTQNLGLEKINLELNENGTIKTNEYMQTNIPNIFACGDVTGPFQLTHAASHQAWYCAINGLFGFFKKFKISYRVIPRVTYTDPEVASVGMNALELKNTDTPFEVYEYEINDLDRAIIDNEDYGKVKVFLRKNSDKILGASIIHPQASSLLSQFTWAMKENKGLTSLLSTIHPYPTMMEANKYVAGIWKKQKRPEFILALVTKYHRFLRRKL